MRDMSASRVQVHIALLSLGPTKHRFSPSRSNPGIGGTYFTAILLAMQLARLHPDWEIVLVHTQALLLDDCPSNVRQVQIADAGALPEYRRANRNGVLICVAVLLYQVPPRLLDEIDQQWIVWSHHPFDPKVRALARAGSRAHVVSVGEYQWHSNCHPRLPVHFIQGIIDFPSDLSTVVGRTPRKAAPRLAHMSSLTRWKGFLDIAREWPRIKRMFPEAELHVVGGSDLHDGTRDHPLIPTSRDFAVELLQHIPESDIANRKVIFHGTMGDSKNEVIANCDLALLNPTGQSEAFPATPLDCMRLGVPVIASDDFGMADSMRWFPELAVSGAGEMPERINWLLADARRYNCLQARSVAIALMMAGNKDESLYRWTWLIEHLANGGRGDIVLHPNQPLHGSMAKLRYRRDVRPALSRIKRSIAGQGAD